MKKKIFTLLTLLATVCSGAWATEWSTVWSTDFASAPSGMTYSMSGSGVTCNIDNGYLNFYNGGGDRSPQVSFTADAFNVATDWKMEFDWNCGSANTNSSNVTFATNKGNAFTLTWAGYASAVVVTDAASTEICNTLPLLGYKKSTCSSWSHVTITGNADAGIYLTITNGTTTYVDNVLVTSTFGYPATFNGSLGKAQASMFLDNVTFATPKVAGFVNAPEGTITAPDGTARKFTLSCLTADVTMYYSETELAVGDAGWTTYSGETTTSAATIYAYAKDGEDNVSAVSSFATGAGEAITLNAPTITPSGMALTGSLYYPIVKIASDQSSLSLVPASPTLTYTLNDVAISGSTPYTFTGTGTLKVTVSADGYTSNEATYTVSSGFGKTKTIDLATVAAGDLSAIWTYEAESALPKGSTTYPQYVYDYRNESASSTDLIDGLTFGISGKTADPGTTMTIYIGKGMILPDKKRNLSDLSVSSSWNSSIAVSLTGGTSDQIVIYTYDTNYNASEATAVTTGDGTYWLYRYSDMLKKVDVYSPAVAVEIGSTGWATFSDATNILDFSSVDGLTAYKITGHSGNAITKSAIDAPVAAGTGLLLNGTASTTYYVPIAASATANVSGNLLKAGTGAAISAEADKTKYVLGVNGSAAQFQKIVSEAATVPVGKAYLQFNETIAARSLTFDEGETTGINAVKSADNNVQGGVYNIAGQRVAQPTKGLYIVNGKKVIIK